MESDSLLSQFDLLNELADNLHPDDEKLRKVLVGMAELAKRKPIQPETPDRSRKEKRHG